ncbi:hypothetical protein GCE86_14290 [Micromonospora terminaliae]|uniref:Integral membrane protein n=1 Tax=Micromonospora terminaliae TaxID=1914461 RepID=A0AAJ2ZBG5_9ACTN|nr:hypothetical protein [Micromonospora terminaliae]NES27145.1 hypothetical protein [Micromonospora terminaliae]QGL48091.1 hypothetical protein GCE86_14290 [Micromonospora terminaliae]
MSEAAARDGPRPSGDVVELRVHGASRASAGEVLDLSRTEQVAGDRSGGFYRVRRPASRTGRTGQVTLEAYRWADLPAGTMARTVALVFLLPFMLVNVAIWMRPANRGSEAAVRSLCRLLALTLTALYVLAAAGVALDLIAWKCLTSPHCLAGRGWLSWLGGRPVGLRLAVLALVPAAAVSLLWRASTRPGRVFEAFRAPEPTAPGCPLGAVGRWDAEPLVGRLRSIHVAAAFATLDVTLLAARAAPGASPGTVALAVVTGAVLVACAVLLCTPPLIDRSAADRRLDRVTGTLRTTAVVLTVVVTAHVLTAPLSWREGGGLPGYDAILTGLFVIQTTLLATLGAVLLFPRRNRRTGAAPLLGLGALAIAAAAISLAVAYSAELVYRVADFLDRDAPTAVGVADWPPRAYTWAIFGFLRAALITLVLAGLAILISRPRRLAAAAAVVARDHPDPPPGAGPRLRQVQKAIARARFTEHLIPLAVVYAGLAGTGTATTTVGLLELWPGDVFERFAGVPADLVTFVISFGSWVIAAIIAGLVLAAVFAYRTVGFRRHVGILWDLGTFWPRAAHPFAPPCYSERAVPELARRITYLVGRGDAVLLTGHSHGSVLAAATVLQLPPEVSSRVALLTYGSPLRRLYARLFPAYVDDEALHEIGARVGWRWLNLWRDTDPVGGWIFAGHPPAAGDATGGPAATVDRRLRDPVAVVAPPGDSVPPPIQGHRPAESDQPFTAAVSELVERLGEPPDQGAVD